MSKTLKVDEVTEALNAAVEEKGEDYVYPNAGDSCTYSDPYADEPTPSCIVGWVIAAVAPKVFEKIRREEASEGESMGVHSLANNGYIKADEVLKEALQAAQSLQDDGHPWGVAREAYNRILAGENRFDVISEIERKRDQEDEADYRAYLADPEA